MKKSANLLVGAFVLAWFMACVPEDKSSGPEIEEPATYGEAEVLLPALPPGFLAKKAGDTLRPVEPMFILTISGNGMVTRKQAWSLGSTSHSVLVSNIPVGIRHFTGEIDLGGNITHADSVVAQIRSGETAMIRLKLGKVGGSALICVEIEGVPLPEGCRPKVAFPNLEGCWSFALPTDGFTRHSLRLFQKDGQIQAELVWSDGVRDTSRGIINSSGWVTLGLDDPMSTWYFSGRADTTDSISNSLNGKFWRKYAEPRNVVLINAVRIPCVPDVKPVEPVPELSCWGVAQTLDGKSAEGRLSLLKKEVIEFTGVFLWNGFTGMAIYGKSLPVNGNQGLYLNGNLPYGLSSKPINQSDPVHYKGQIPPDRKSILYGTIYGTDNTGSTVQRGIWKGYPLPCTETDRRMVDGARSL